MAVTISLYNHTAKKFAAQEVTLSTLKLMLLNASASYDATDAALDDVAGALAGSPEERPNEVYGNGWTQGGETLASAAVTVTTTNDAKLDADDVSVTANGGTIGPATAAVLYDDTDAAKAPLAYIDFGEAKSAGDGTAFLIRWNTGGIITWANAG